MSTPAHSSADVADAFEEATAILDNELTELSERDRDFLKLFGHVVQALLQRPDTGPDEGPRQVTLEEVIGRHYFESADKVRTWWSDWA
ncbi:hypothetical protein GCM10022221_67420 [Actinocorallia aurea]